MQTTPNTPKTLRIIKLFKNAAKLDDGRIWNRSRIVRIEKRNENIEHAPDSLHGDMIDNGHERRNTPKDPEFPQSGDKKQPTRISTRSHMVPKGLVDFYW